MKTIDERLEELTKKISSDEFQKSYGLGNEVDFHVFDYDPEDEYKVKDYFESYLILKEEFHLKLIDVYDCILEILVEKGYLDKVFKLEKNKGIEYTNNVIANTIGIGSKNDLLLHKITEKIERDDTVVLKGIGKCYGIVRAHTILSNLEKNVEANPVILLYPGSYDENGLRLFNRLKPNDYYKAIQLVYRK